MRVPTSGGTGSCPQMWTTAARDPACTYAAVHLLIYPGCDPPSVNHFVCKLDCKSREVLVASSLTLFRFGSTEFLQTEHPLTRIAHLSLHRKTSYPRFLLRFLHTCQYALAAACFLERLGASVGAARRTGATPQCITPCMDGCGRIYHCSPEATFLHNGAATNGWRLPY